MNKYMQRSELFVFFSTPKSGRNRRKYEMQKLKWCKILKIVKPLYCKKCKL